MHEIERLVAHVEASVQPEGIHLSAGRWPDAVKLANRQGFYERRSHLRRDDVLAVRLAVVGRELRQKLVVGDAGGSVEVSLLFDLGADRQSDVARKRNALQVYRDVQIRLVEGKRFDDRCVLGEYLADVPPIPKATVGRRSKRRSISAQ